MSLSFGFYNSSGGDRRYDARQISRLFNALIKDGVFMHIGSHFAVTEGSGMSVNVGTGYAWFNSTWTLNDAPLPITAEQSDLLLTRIDALVLEINETVNSRTNSIKFVKGTPSANPQKPSLTNTNDVHQYALAYITVAPGTETITQANIENNVGMEGCPFVVGILETIDISSLIAQWETQWDEWLTQQKEETDEFQKTSEADFTAWSTERKQEITNFQETSEASFLAWFENIKDKLGEDPAGELQNQVDELKAAVTGYPLKFSANTNSLQITAKRNSIESLTVEGFTKQAGSGDASPTNVRAISVATKRMVEYTLTGSENWKQGGTSESVVNYKHYYISDTGEGTNDYKFCSAFPYVKQSAYYANQNGIYYSEGGSAIRFGVDASAYPNVEAWKAMLADRYADGNPIKVWYIPADTSKATGIYLPIERTDESGYHCDCVELSADLCEGDKVETFVKSGCDTHYTFDGSADESWVLMGNTGTVNRFYINIKNSQDVPVLTDISFPFYCTRFAANKNGQWAANGGDIDDKVGLCAIFNGTFRVAANFKTADELKTWLQSNPIDVWYQSTLYSANADTPLELETHESRVLILDGTNEGLQMDELNVNRILLPLPDAKPAQLPSCDKYTASSGNEDKSIYIDNAFTPRLGVIDSRFTDLGTAKSVLASDPASVVYKLQSAVSYAHDPVQIPNEDGVTVISTQENCVLEVSLTKNDAKTFKATFLASAWISSGSEFTQEATVKCIDGPGALTEDSKWDSPIYVEQTSVLATNEKLIDALTTLNAGEILFKNGAISCRVLEKPVSDIEILFKAKR